MSEMLPFGNVIDAEINSKKKTEKQKLIEELKENKLDVGENNHYGFYVYEEKIKAKIQERIKCNQEEVLYLEHILDSVDINEKMEDKIYFKIKERINFLKSEIKLGQEAIK